jgi:hypothetical protein
MGYYQEEEIEFAPVWENTIFYKVKNMIIKEAKDDIKPENAIQNGKPCYEFNSEPVQNA